MLIMWMNAHERLCHQLKPVRDFESIKGHQVKSSPHSSWSWRNGLQTPTQSRVNSMTRARKPLSVRMAAEVKQQMNDRTFEI
jgi:hypothetical protein